MTGLKVICKQINSFYENGTPVLDYAYIEDLKDGRGYTAGYFGCCSGTGDMLQVLENWQSLGVASSIFRLYLPRLRELANTGSGSVDGLEGLPEKWKSCSELSVFRKCQDEVCDELYWKPAEAYAKKLRIKSALGQAILYDTIIQHGDGDDPDSIGAIIKETDKKFPHLTKRYFRSETDWLVTFLGVRHNVLLHATDSATFPTEREPANSSSNLIN